MSSATDKKQWVGNHRWLLGGVVGGLAVIGLVLGLTAGSSNSSPMSTRQEREFQAAIQRYNAGAAGRRRAQRAASAAAALGSADETVQGDYDNVLNDEGGVAGGLSSLRSNTTSTLTSIAGLAANLETIRKALAVEVAAGGTTEAGESDAVTVENDVSIFRDNLYGDQTGGFEPAASTISELRYFAKLLPTAWKSLLRAEKIDASVRKFVPHALRPIIPPSASYEQHLLSQVAGVIAHAEAVGAMGNRVSASDLAEAKALLIRGNDLAKLPPLTDWAQAGF